jgi:hypothetical protein
MDAGFDLAEDFNNMGGAPRVEGGGKPDANVTVGLDGTMGIGIGGVY